LRTGTRLVSAAFGDNSRTQPSISPSDPRHPLDTAQLLWYINDHVFGLRVSSRAPSHFTGALERPDTGANNSLSPSANSPMQRPSSNALTSFPARETFEFLSTNPPRFFSSPERQKSTRRLRASLLPQVPDHNSEYCFKTPWYVCAFARYKNNIPVQQCFTAKHSRSHKTARALTAEGQSVVTAPAWRSSGRPPMRRQKSRGIRSTPPPAACFRPRSPCENDDAFVLVPTLHMRIPACRDTAARNSSRP
jgi:hypothetical protein